jgi:hypothetical protein
LAFLVGADDGVEGVLAAYLAADVFLGKLKYLFGCDLF